MIRQIIIKDMLIRLAYNMLSHNVNYKEEVKFNYKHLNKGYLKS